MKKQMATVILALVAMTSVQSAFAGGAEKCAQLVNELGNQKLLGSLEGRAVEAATAAYRENRTPENRDKIRIAMDALNDVAVKATDICEQILGNP